MADKGKGQTTEAQDAEAAKEEEAKPAWNSSTMGPLDDANADAYDVQPAPGAEPDLNAYGKPREPEEKVAPKTDAQAAEAAKQGKS